MIFIKHKKPFLTAVVLALGLSFSIGSLSYADPRVGDVSESAFLPAGAAVPNRRGGQAVETDPLVLSAMREGTPRFIKHTYTDPKTDVSLDYNLYIPTDFTPGKQYPLVMYIPDASSAGKSAASIARQYYGADVWVTKAAQTQHPAIVVVPAYSTVAVDDSWATSDQVGITMHLLQKITDEYPVDTSRIYTTGQSMGCMISLYLMSQHPDFFAAGLFVSGQWDSKVLSPIAKKPFLYITAAGDEKASGGQDQLMALLAERDIPYTFDTWSAQDPLSIQNQNVRSLTEKGTAHFLRFTKGSVLKDGNQMEHMASFNYAYKIPAVRNWLFQQVKQ